ncbi:MAG: Ni,Fe-hydrogenase III large subunit [Cyclobacteriaceae bacterium]|jgi:Ni,Fe-hydrogenase III large subunit
MEAKKYIELDNNETVPIAEIPFQSEGNFQNTVTELMHNPNCHCVNYFGYKNEKELNLIMCIADDSTHKILVFGHMIESDSDQRILSLTKEIFALHIFEREIHENFGTNIFWHPWLKPVRYAEDRSNKDALVNDYPFYSIDSPELHEVGVGPIHAGVIEPGHFRFICNGELVLHLEIQLGWQHRGIEPLMLKKKKLLQRNILAESITGDTTIGHSTAFVHQMESLAGIEISTKIQIERAIALELERIAVHVGDLSAMCTDVAYQLGSAVFGALRTPIINFMQAWCGNRFGKGLIRTGGSHYPLTKELIDKIEVILEDFESRFNSISDKTFNLTSVYQRFEGIGKLEREQVELLGGVGMVARMSGIERDTRKTHPYGAFQTISVNPATANSGDVWARGTIRRDEIINSIEIIRKLIQQRNIHDESNSPQTTLDLQKNSFSISLTEGWRGEICHCSITDDDGELKHYKIKDPSMHNWKALELALRDLEISDFPINNKSFDLSYCGHDL